MASDSGKMPEELRNRIRDAIRQTVYNLYGTMLRAGLSWKEASALIQEALDAAKADAMKDGLLDEEIIAAAPAADAVRSESGRTPETEASGKTLTCGCISHYEFGCLLRVLPYGGGGIGPEGR